MLDAIVVGAGINGMAAAVTLARAGLSVRVYEQAASVGGGCRSAELTDDSLMHDVCASVVPLAVASPFFAEVTLDSLGVELVWPDVEFAHPVSIDRAAIVRRSVVDTAVSLGSDGPAYRALLEPHIDRIQALVDLTTGPLLRWPGDMREALRFGAHGVLSANALSRRFTTEEARALLAGGAAHSTARLSAPLTGGMAMLFPLLAHAFGWPFVVGGTQRIIDGLADHLRSLGGEIVTNHPVERLDALPAARSVVLDVMPSTLLRMAGGKLPASYAWQLRRWRHGPGVCKVDFALTEPVPWANAELARAGTVHLGGTARDVELSEDAVSAGRHADRPFVLAAQATAFDPSRAPRGGHTLWTYCHVPNGSTRDMTAAIVTEVERFAPGFRDVVRATHVRTAADYEQYNPSFVGGDITGGAPTILQTAVRPALAFPPYRTPLKGVYLCSAATPPGAGVHGMSGYQAARAALRSEFGIRTR